MSNKTQETTSVRALPADAERMDKLVPKLEKRHRGATFKRPGVITKALDALERELSKPVEQAQA